MSHGERGGRLSTRCAPGYPQATTICYLVHLVDTLLIVTLSLCFACATVSLWALAAMRQIRRTVLDAQRITRMVGEHEIALAGLEERFQATIKLLRKVAAREAMRDHRGADPGPGQGAAPDWRTDPQGFIAHHQARLNNQRGNIHAVSSPSAGNWSADQGDPGIDAILNRRPTFDGNAAPAPKKQRRRKPRTGEPPTQTH
ncbi:MAG: hypothetical protein [Circular genetic element sp.]|nr:MAG: hypothetical protein [Circular genetic element sp.]